MKKYNERIQKNQAVEAYEKGEKSQRGLAQELGIERTTLQYWIEKKGKKAKVAQVSESTPVNEEYMTQG